MLTCREQCTARSQPSSEHAAWSRSRNQSPLREKSNAVKHTPPRKCTTCVLHGSSPVRSAHACKQCTQERKENMATTCCQLHKAFKGCQDMEMIKITPSGQTPLHSPIHEYRELLPSCHSYTACAPLCAYEVALSILKLAMKQGCIAENWYVVL